MIARKHRNRYSDQKSYAGDEIYHPCRRIPTNHIISILAPKWQNACLNKFIFFNIFLQNILHERKIRLSLHSHLRNGEIAQLVRAHDS